MLHYSVCEDFFKTQCGFHGFHAAAAFEIYLFVNNKVNDNG